MRGWIDRVFPTENGPWPWRRAPRRAVSWQGWVLLWLLPAGFVLGGLAELGLQALDHARATRVTGTVVRVYDWPNNAPFASGRIYAPVFSYPDGDGLAGASSNMAAAELDFPVGSTHDILVFPGSDRDVIVPGRHNWLAGQIVLGIGLVLILPALVVHAGILRWLRAG
ncbi:hypothetical protein KUH32_15085 [Thalassococcus sp. CAU 1522]|uniref:DUF3592 domain-containing protein n=1 Tax=Thalassococcus arenae TaxID=2851652 RepID=A0ABS6NAP3_9RHOB|nr:hypothetical protein [Thalassococcus arenae]MBV2361088.1 hypothetical protein [Thalassococcus arenae]